MNTNLLNTCFLSLGALGLGASEASAQIRAMPINEASSASLQAPSDSRVISFMRSVRGVGSALLTHTQTNALIVALDSESPASFLERVQLAAMALHDAKGGGVSVYSAQDFCQIHNISSSKGAHSYKGLDRNIAEQLMNISSSKQGGGFLGRNNRFREQRGPCGSGALREVRVVPVEDNSFKIDFVLSRSIFTGNDQVTASSNNMLRYFSSLNADTAMTIQRIIEIKRNQSLSNALNASFKRSSLGFDIMEGFNAVMDAINNEPTISVSGKLPSGRTVSLPNNELQAHRVLSNYSVYAFSPIEPSTGIRMNTGRNNFFVGTEFLMHAPGLAVDQSNQHGHRKAVLSIRPIVQEVSSNRFQAVDIEVEFGESRIASDIQVAPEWQPMVNRSLEAISKTIEAHANGLSQTGIGIMYGPKARYASLSQSEKTAYINRYKKAGTNPKMPEETSCIGFVQNHLRTGYQSTGRTTRFREIDKRLAWSNGQGTHLLAELQKDGWKLIFWSPDARNPTRRVRVTETPSNNVAHHTWSYSMANSGKGYMAGVLSYGHVFEGLKVDYLVTNYRPTNPARNQEEVDAANKLYAQSGYKDNTLLKTLRNNAADELLQKLPFFVGVANGGYHVYLGSKGMIIESHSTRGPTDNTNIELRPMNQFGLFSGENYLSGVIAVPPGPWEQTISSEILRPANR